MTRDEILGEINRQIAEAELHSSTLAAEVTALSQTDGDPTEMVELLWRTMDRLDALRRQRTAFEIYGQPGP